MYYRQDNKLKDYVNAEANSVCLNKQNESQSASDVYLN